MNCFRHWIVCRFPYGLATFFSRIPFFPIFLNFILRANKSKSTSAFFSIYTIFVNEPLTQNNLIVFIFIWVFFVLFASIDACDRLLFFRVFLFLLFFGREFHAKSKKIFLFCITIENERMKIGKILIQISMATCF